LITHVAVGKLTMHDQDALEPALDDTAQRGWKPNELLADSHFGSNECLAKGQKRHVEIISPAMTAKGKRQGKLTLEDFELDSQGRVVRCPAGQEPVETSVADVRIQALFDSAVCQACPQRGDCPAAAIGRSEQRWQYNHDRVKQRERRLQNASEEFRQRYRWRAGIEATMSRFKHQMTMAHLRVRGMAKVTYAAMLRALGLNIFRVAAYRTARTRACVGKERLPVPPRKRFLNYVLAGQIQQPCNQQTLFAAASISETGSRLISCAEWSRPWKIWEMSCSVENSRCWRVLLAG